MEKELHDFKALFYGHYQALCNYAFKYLSNRDECEDVVQEVMIRFWELKKDMIKHPAARYYLFTAVRNRCISAIRKKNNLGFVSIGQYGIDVADEVYEEMEHKDINQLVETAFATLSPKCAEVFKLSRVEKLKYNEIAEKLGISVKTVENQMGKAIKHMRDFISKNPVFSVFIILFATMAKYIGVLLKLMFYKGES